MSNFDTIRDQSRACAIKFSLFWDLKSCDSLFVEHELKNGVQRSRWLRFTNKRGEITYPDKYCINGAEIFVLGDPVFPVDVKDHRLFLFNRLTAKNLSDIGGFWYLIKVDQVGRNITIANGSFGVFPLYYYENSDCWIVSSTTNEIREIVGGGIKLDKQYLLERCLFNYSFQNRTYWAGMKTVPAHSLLTLSDRCSITTYWKPEDLMVQKPVRGRQVLDNLTSGFAEVMDKYLPNSRYAVSFTGGFDGRTLTAASCFLKRDFFAYSFGSEDSTDLTLPLQQSAQLGIDFLPIYLDQEYTEEHSFADGMGLISLTEGYASFARAHYHYAAKKLSTEVEYMITGNFGSEVFRAAHIPGAVLSKELFGIIGSSSTDLVRSAIFNSPKLKLLNHGLVNQYADQLVEEILLFRDNYKGLSPSALLYVYNLNEMFRKYFGPEIVMQSTYLNNRSPFLDYGLITMIMNTFYCGIYSDFLTNNPIKRFKGQLPYSYMIKQFSNTLFNLPTNKGYKPSDLLSFQGKFNLTLNLLRKRVNKARQARDPYSVDSAFRFNVSKWSAFPIIDDIYNSSEVNKLKLPGSVGDRYQYESALSSSIYLQEGSNRK